MTRVHTDHYRFRIPDNECLAGPLVEVAHRQIGLTEEIIKEPYILKIPHCIRNQQDWKFIKVRSGSIYKQNPLGELSPHDTDDGEAFFTVDSDFITIFTYHFCHFICTVCKKSCPAAAKVFLCGSLITSEKDLTTDVEIKPFLCSFLYLIKDFKKVSSVFDANVYDELNMYTCNFNSVHMCNMF